MTRRRRCNRRSWRQFAALALLAVACSARAEDAAGIRRVLWAPQPLAVGSPCLFTVELDRPALSVKGRWMGHEFLFWHAAKPAGARTWYALAGVDVEAASGKEDLSIEAAFAAGETLRITRTVEIVPSAYKILALRVADRFVEPDAATLARIAAEKQIKEAAFAHQLEPQQWTGNFLPPVEALVTEPFGTRRVFNSQTASVHRGLDFHAGIGTRVHAANSGQVVLAQNLFYEGGTIVIDHGAQFMSLYMHLSKIAVAVGEHVNRGQQIGLSGATGRVTGPHLHMAVRWQGTYLDPARLFRLTLPDSGAK